MDVEVEQSRLAAGLLADRPGERGRDERRPDAATDADDGGQVMRLVVEHVGMFRRRKPRLGHRPRFAHLIERQGLEKIVLDAARPEVALKTDTIGRAARRDRGCQYVSI